MATKEITTLAEKTYATSRESNPQNSELQVNLLCKLIESVENKSMSEIAALKLEIAELKKYGKEMMHEKRGAVKSNNDLRRKNAILKSKQKDVEVLPVVESMVS